LLSRRFGRDQILGCYDLPASISPNPSIGPHKAATLTSASLPGFVALCDRGVAVKRDIDLIKAIGNEVLLCISRVGDHFRFVVTRPLRIYAQEIIRKNPFDCARVASGYRFRPLAFAFDNLALCFLLIVSRALTEQVAKRASNKKAVDSHLADRMLTLTREL
jgi:hypothetical protein